MTGIYQIVNIINNKCYIGSSIDVENRMYMHKIVLQNNKHFNKHLQHAYNKHGLQNFKFEIIEECLKENLIKREQHHINLYSFKKELYNISGIAGRVEMTVEVRQKISSTKKGIRAWNKGKKHTEQSKQKMSESQKGKLHTPESKQKISKALTGIKRKPFTEEHKQKISESLIGYKHTLETKQKMSIAQKGKKLTEEHKQKISESHKGNKRGKY